LLEQKDVRWAFPEDLVGEAELAQPGVIASRKPTALA
jgi:hypothetical protein